MFDTFKSRLMQNRLILEVIILLVLALPILPVIADESGQPDMTQQNTTCHNDHFFGDNVLVMASGASYGAVIECICSRLTLPHRNRAYYCKSLGAVAAPVIYLTLMHLTRNLLHAGGGPTLILLTAAPVYISSTPFKSATVQNALTTIFCYQCSKIFADSVSHSLWHSDPDNQSHITQDVIVNGIITGMITYSMALWYTRNQEGTLTFLFPVLGATGTTLLATPLYFTFSESGQLSLTEEVVSVAIAVSVTGAVAFIAAVAESDGDAIELLTFSFAALASAMQVPAATCRLMGLAGAETGAVYEAEAGTITGSLVLFMGLFVIGYEAEDRALVKIDAGIIAGVVAGTGFLTATVFAVTFHIGHWVIISSQYFLKKHFIGRQSQNNIRSLAQIVHTGVPLLFASWIVAHNQWITKGVPAHETMKNIYRPVF